MLVLKSHGGHSKYKQNLRPAGSERGLNLKLRAADTEFALRIESTRALQVLNSRIRIAGSDLRKAI